MKKIKIAIISSIAFIILCSCATTPSKSNEIHTENQNHPVETKTVIEETPEEKFLKSLEGISIKNTGTPKEITKGKSFATPFTFQVTSADGNALSDFAVTLEYPASKNEGIINFEQKELRTDENGNITFTAEETSFAAKSEVKVYPTPVSKTPELLEKVQVYSAKADWKVRSNIATKGAVLFVWDYNEKERPVNNSYDIQAEFRTRGITMVGNGPVNETSYIGKPKSLYKDTYDIIGGTQYGYLIYGTIKFEQPVTAKEDGNGYFCILKAEIEAVTMKNGEKIYSSEIKYESNGKNWNECVSNGKEKLAELVVNDIIYGL